MADLDYEDIQGLIFRGYGNLPASNFILLRIMGGREADARKWLGSLDVTDATRVSHRTDAVHVAFTLEGLRKLGLRQNETRFSCEFEEGMTTKSRQRTLGDHGDSAPEKWSWGGNQAGDSAIHILLMLYAQGEYEDDTGRLDVLYAQHKERFEERGLVEVKRISTRTLIERKEHFGFADGIAQPILSGTRRASDPKNAANVIAVGEFIMGHENEYAKLPESPTIPAARSSDHGLSLTDDGTVDFGKNGSYLVFRQLEQDVKGFWEFLDQETKTDGVSDPGKRDWMAAKMVGRWRSGVALMQSPERDDPAIAPGDRFGYMDPKPDGKAKSDPFGVTCPLGSHIRRSNPRDSVFPGDEAALTIPNVHRILRRGRSYGPPVARSMEPDDVLAALDTGEERGLNFICFNTDIGRQFEFVQHTWINNPKFGSMYAELDPLVGDHDGKRHRDSKGMFTIPTDGVRTLVTGVKRYVKVRGGAYFFMPGIKAIKTLADLQ